jgi:hypothetical protein
MIISENAQSGDMNIFRFLIYLAYPDATTQDVLFSQKLVEDNVITTEMLHEKAIEMENPNLKRVTMDGMDFDDGSDAKKATTVKVHERKVGKTDGRRRAAIISSIATKVGTLRCIVAETKTNKLYFFAIPYDAYGNRGLSKLAIYFNWDGTPKRDGKWFQYECSTYQEMANVPNTRSSLVFM